MDELREILIILSPREVLHILRGFVFLSQLSGQTRKGKPEFPHPAGAAFSAPRHPHTERVTLLPSPTWKPSLRKLGAGVGKPSFLPGPKCALQSRWPSGTSGRGLTGRVWPQEEGRGLRKGMVGPPSPPVASQTKPHPLPGRRKRTGWSPPRLPLHNSKVLPEETVGAGLQLPSAEEFCRWFDNGLCQVLPAWKPPPLAV